MDTARQKIFQVHLNGKLEVRSRRPIRTEEALRLVYTPGVAEVCRHLQSHPEDQAAYTWVGRTVAVVTNGTAVLSLGAIGPEASLPVMEAKAALFRELAGLNAVPILIRTREPELFVRTVEQIAPSFGAIMLEDIESPACFVIERRLQEQLNIPVLHADQHATAVAVLAAVMNAVSILEKRPSKFRVLLHGAGPSGLAIARLLRVWGVKDLALCRGDGSAWAGDEVAGNPAYAALAPLTRPCQETARFEELLRGRDILISTSGGFRLSRAALAAMAPQAVVLAISNPQPLVAPQEALAAGCAFALDGTAVNNALAFPGLFQGVLESRAHRFEDAMLLAAAKAIAQAAPEGRLVPDQLDRKLHRKVARAVAKTALADRQEMADCEEWVR
ncbi:MAG: NAD-dependent malic enzyme [Candidatus Omnitrophica bacterium]|nr:NAD-dependent malic enzyme [Candidatus Omnitrophota bacterium]